MLASVLNSPISVQAGIQVVRAFIRLRELVAENREFARKLDRLERRFQSHDVTIRNLFQAIRDFLDPPVAQRARIGFRPVKNPSGSR